MKWILKVFLWLVGGLLGLAVLAMVVLFAINATDEPLSEESQALLRLPSPPPPSERNGYIDFLALGAPANAPTFATGVAQLKALNTRQYDKRITVKADPRVRQCNAGSYLSCVAANPSLKQVLDSHTDLRMRYAAMRVKPEFVDLERPTSPEDDSLNGRDYQKMGAGQRLALMLAAFEFNAGRRAAAIGELEADISFYRKMAAGSGASIPKMVAFARLDADALFAAEVARKLPVDDREQWSRLQALLRPPTSAELDMTGVLNRERADVVNWMRTRQYVRLSDAMYEAMGPSRQRPWWDAVAPWLYRPHYSVNRYVVESGITLSVADRPAHEFLAARQEAQARVSELYLPIWKALVLSPAGTFNFHLASDVSYYVGSMHGHVAVQSIVALQLRLRAAGITTPAEVTHALTGSVGSSYPNPFTGKPMEFDAQKMTIGFPCDAKFLSPSVRTAIFSDGRVALSI